MNHLFKLVALAGFLVLGACSTIQSIGKAISTAASPVGSTGSAAAINSAYALKSGYAVALVAMNTYGALPPCGSTGATAICFSLSLGVQLEKGRAAAASAIDSFEAAALSVTPSTTVMAAAETAAKAALASFQTIVTAYAKVS